MSAAISGHIYLEQGKRGPVWYYRARVPEERRRAIGPGWSGRGRPPAGYFTKRTAQALLDDVLADARQGRLAGPVKTGATVADAAREWLRYVEDDRGRKPSTIVSYKTTVEAFVIPSALGNVLLEQVTTPMIERWRELTLAGRSPRTVNRRLMELHGIFERARRKWGQPVKNPVTEVEKFPVVSSGELDFYNPAEVLALVRAAAHDQDGAIFLTAAFTGLRLGELIALRARPTHCERVSKLTTKYTECSARC